MPLPAAMDARARIDAVRLGAALYAQTRFQGTTPLPFVHPDKPHEGTVTGKLRAVDECPAVVGSVVGNLGAFCCSPPGSVFSHGLLACTRIRGHGRRGERATMTPDAVGYDGETAMAARYEKGGRLRRAQRV
eukprot:185365-Pleurochrysis_carterae.AAC.2